MIILNKTDLVSKDKLSTLEQRITNMNPTAKRLHAKDCNIKLVDVLGINTFDVNRKLEIDPHFLEDHHHHHHDDKVSSIAFREERPLDMDKLDRWMSYLVQEKGEDLLRYKGIIYVKGLDERIVFQGIHMLFAGHPDRKWRKGETKMSEMVFIGKDLDKNELEHQFKNCIATP